MVQNYYKILGIKPTANAAEIKDAYRHLVHKYHPDLNTSPDSSAKIIEINNAYSVLKDTKKRVEYHRNNPDILKKNSQSNSSQVNQNIQPKNKPNSGFNNSPFLGSDSVSFDEILTAFGQTSQSKQSQKKFDNGDHTLDLNQKALNSNNAEYSNTIDSNQTNHSSSSTNNKTEDTSKPTSQCHQNIQTDTLYATKKNSYLPINIDLALAYTGGVYPLILEVPVKDTNGSMSHEIKKLQINIPKGVGNGTKICLKGLASTGDSSTNGDLYLTININEIQKIKVDGNDVYQTVNITPWEALFGDSIRIDTFTERFDVNIPQGSQSGQTLRIKGKGIPAEIPGNLYLVLNIVNPDFDTLTKQQKAVYESMETLFKDTIIKR